MLGDEEALASTIKGLKSAASHLRSKLARSLNLRNTPELTFVGDCSIAYGVSMSKLIQDVTAQLPERSDEEEETEEDW